MSDPICSLCGQSLLKCQGFCSPQERINKLKLDLKVCQQTASRYRVECNALSRRLKKALREVERLKK